MDSTAGLAMLATVGGSLALLLGLLLLLLPLLATELSRPRDSVWGAVVLLLGLVLVTSADRLTGAPMLAVLCGGLLIGRLSSEVGQARWRQLSDDERQLLASSERWSRSAQQLAASCSSLLTQARGLATGLARGLGTRLSSRSQRPGPGSAKRWVRPELPAAASGAGEASPQSPPPAAAEPRDLAPEPEPPPLKPPASATPAGARSPEAPAPAPQEAAGVRAASARDEAAAAPGPGEPRSRVVRDFSEITALLAAAPAPEPEPEAEAEAEAEPSEAG